MEWSHRSPCRRGQNDNVAMKYLCDVKPRAPARFQHLLREIVRSESSCSANIDSFPLSYYCIVFHLLYIDAERRKAMFRVETLSWFVALWFFFLNYVIVVQLQSSALTTYHSPPPHLPLGFVHVSFIIIPETTPLPPIISSRLPSGYCQIVLNFNVFGYILFACFFCCLGSS